MLYEFEWLTFECRVREYVDVDKLATSRCVCVCWQENGNETRKIVINLLCYLSNNRSDWRKKSLWLRQRYMPERARTHACSLTNNTVTREKEWEKKEEKYTHTKEKRFSFAWHLLRSRFSDFHNFSRPFVILPFVLVCFLRRTRENSSFGIIFFSCRICSLSHERNAFGL